MGEYIKAWFILHVIAKEFGLGAQDGFQFNISVGYDLAGIKGDKVNTFIDGMMEAKDTVIFQECRKWLLDNADKFQNFTREDIEAIPSNVCNSATTPHCMDVLHRRLRALQIICLQRNI